VADFSRQSDLCQFFSVSASFPVSEASLFLGIDKDYEKLVSG
jgi:hypothetical protein